MKKQRKTNSLPSEIFEEIFSRFSVKTLVQLTLVCKSWNSIISDQSFARHHLRINTNNNNSKFFLTSEFQLRIRRSDTLGIVEKLHPTNKFINPDICPIIAHVDGVLLVHICSPQVYEGNNLILLWNPTIPKIVSVPPYRSLKKGRDVNFGFGFDGIDNTYKVVALNLEFFRSKTKVYSLRTRKWALPKTKRCKIIPVLYLKRTQMTTNYNDGIFWLASVAQDNASFRHTHLIRFDLSSEAFTCNRLPDIDDSPSIKRRHRQTSILYDSLALVDLYQSNDVDTKKICLSNTQLRICIWVMKGKKMGKKKNCWTKLYDLNLGYVGVYKRKYLHLKNSGELYLIEGLYKCYSKTSVLDLKTQQEKILPKGSDRVTPLISFIDTYVESLVLLREPNGNDPQVTETLRSVIQGLPSAD